MIELLAFRNQFLVDCKGFDSSQETAALLASVYGGIDSLKLQKIKERTHRGLTERAKAGYSAGGKVYGYDSVPIDPDDRDSMKRYVFNDTEARIVREIFKRYANGESPKTICNDLNRRDIPSLVHRGTAKSAAVADEYILPWSVTLTSQRIFKHCRKRSWVS